MAFGFDDFAKLFDPVSDLLGTSGKKGVGLLQQDPEDLAMLAALAAGGYGALTAVPGATGIAAAGPSAALVTPEVAALAPEVASLGAEEATRLAAEETARIAAQEAAQRGILQANQMDPGLLASLEPNAAGIRQTAGLGNDIQDYLVKNKYLVEGIELDPSKALPDFRALGTEQQFARDSAIANVNSVPPGLESQINAQQIADYGTQPMTSGAVTNFSEPTEQIIRQNTPEYANYLEAANTDRYKGSFDDYQRIQFDNELLARRTAAPPSTIQQFENPASTTQNMFRGNPAEAGFQPPQVTRGGYFNNGITGEYTDTLTPFERGMETAGKYFDKAATFAKDYPYPAAGLAYYTAYKTGMLDQKPVEAPADDYKNPYSMAGFRRSSPAPSAYRYTPRYAEGGIAGYAKGGRSKAKSAMDFYDAMNPQQESAPLSHGSPGIYYDTDADTRYLDPMEDAMVRMSKLNSRTNVQAPAMAPSRRMGELDFKPVAAAQGGIMGYADGGMPLEDDMYIRLTGRNDRASDRMPGPDVPFSPTSESAAAVSKFGQGMKDYPAIAPGGIAAQVIGSIASAYGDHMARNVNPNYSNEGRQQMQAAEAAARDSRVAAFDAGRTHEGGGGGQGPSVSSSDFGGGSFDPAGRDSDGTPLAKGGGIMGYNLGGYAAGGNPRLLRGPGDGMSDHIPATINNRQPARLADGEYVITADVVSHLGNGSTEAGARQLDAMMKRIRKGRTGTSKQGKQINPRKYLPA